jgi:hypothetical protein
VISVANDARHAQEGHDMETEMEQPIDPASPPPQSFESRLSRVRAWTLLPTFYATVAGLAARHIRSVTRSPSRGTARRQRAQLIVRYQRAPVPHA